jgi:hypothetical protein
MKTPLLYFILLLRQRYFYIFFITYLSKEIAPCLHALAQAPQLMHFFTSTTTLFSLFKAPTGHASTHPLQAPPQEQLEHLPSFQQHFA